MVGYDGKDLQKREDDEYGGSRIWRQMRSGKKR